MNTNNILKLKLFSSLIIFLIFPSFTVADSGNKSISKDSIILSVDFTDYYLSVTAQNENINDVFKEISLKTGVRIFSDSRIGKQISVNFKKKGFTRGMKLILAELGLDEYKGKLILGKTFSGSIYRISKISRQEIRKKQEKAISFNVQGEKLLEEGKDYQAFRLFIKALISNQKFLPAHKNLVRIYVLWEDHEKLIERLGKVINLAPIDAENYRLLADTYRKNYRLDKAMANYNKFLTKSSKKEEIEDVKGIIAQMNKEANKLYFQKISDARDLISTGQFDDAMEILIQAMDIDPLNSGSYEYMAILEEIRKDYETAIKWRKKLAELAPGNQRNLLLLGRDLKMTSNDQAASEYLTKTKLSSKSEYMTILVDKELKMLKNN